jgi:hypothetical protein
MEKQTLHEKLLKVQKEIVGISKDNKNPHFRSYYADINSIIKAVKPVLNKYGIKYSAPIENDDLGNQWVVTRLSDGKESEESKLRLIENDNPQKIGSCITYYRRYTLISLLGLEVEDDDGEAAAGNNKSKATPQKVSALIRANKKDAARNYLGTVDWTGQDSLKNKLISHFKTQ